MMALDRRLIWWGLVLAMVAAAALRLPFLDHQSLWYDEVYTRDIVGARSLPGLWRHLEATESTPPLYYVVAWLLGGRSALALRVIPALALVAAVPVSFAAFRRLVGERAALAAAAIVAVNPLLSWFALDGRSYGLFVLMAMVSVWGFAAARDGGALRYWVAASVACIWTHYFGVFLVAAEAVLLVPRRRLMVAVAAIVACCAPLVPLIAAAAGHRTEGVATGSLAARVWQTVRQFAAGPNAPRLWLELAASALLWGAVLFALGRSRERPKTLFAVATLTLMAPLALAATGAYDRYAVRNLLVLVPIVAALAAPVLLRGRGVPLTCYLALAAAASVWVASDWRYQQPDWRDALARVEAVAPGTSLIETPWYESVVVRTYLGRGPAPAALRVDRAWLVVEPKRSPDAALTAVTAPRLPAGFAVARAYDLRGFRVLLLRAPRPRRLRPLPFRTAVLFTAAPSARRLYARVAP
jgi:uncharacterized membrane protein